jgi:Uncharacterized conserved protein
MLYVSGVHALNISCILETCGDWHQSAIQWKNIPLIESEESIYGDYGIELNKKVPEHTETFAIANHIRALLDLLQDGKFSVAQGMKNDFICNDKYTDEIFQKVSLLKKNKNWNEIDNFMKKEYLSRWSDFNEQVITLPENNSWRVKHRVVMTEFLKYLNEKSNDFVLKGGTALMICYGLDRFSEEIEMDGVQGNISGIIVDFCNNEGYSYSIVKDTDIAKSYVIDYGDTERPVKVEVFFRRKSIDPDEVDRIQGISVYKVEYICIMKVNAYNRNHKIRDLYDLMYICNNFWEQLSADVKSAVREAFSYKNIEYFTYLTKNQTDNLIDNSKLAASFLLMYDRLGLVVDEKELNELRNIIQLCEKM